MLYPHLEGRRIVLASQSPRRRELMGMLGLEVECIARDVDESWPQELEGVGVAEYVARKKATAYLDVLRSGDTLITGDTVVVLHGVQDVMGLIGVTRLTGSFYTVMGMPTHRLHALLDALK